MEPSHPLRGSKRMRIGNTSGAAASPSTATLAASLAALHSRLPTVLSCVRLRRALARLSAASIWLQARRAKDRMGRRRGQGLGIRPKVRLPEGLSKGKLALRDCP